MMSVSDAVASRHSVRVFTDRKVTRQPLESILDKALFFAAARICIY